MIWLRLCCTKFIAPLLFICLWIWKGPAQGREYETGALHGVDLEVSVSMNRRILNKSGGLGRDLHLLMVDHQAVKIHGLMQVLGALSRPCGMVLEPGDVNVAGHWPRLNDIDSHL